MGHPPTTVNAMANGPGYDDAGDVTNDNHAFYLYDAEGRICAVQDTSIPGAYAPYGYLYNATGTRTAKGTLSTLSCDVRSNGFTPTTIYMLGLGGEQLAEFSGAVTWVHTNVFAGGKLLATYSATDNDTHFPLADWLGTKRAELTTQGKLSTFYSLPFGNGLQTGGAGLDATEHHFTGKERDAESGGMANGNDYFGARYYNSATGRWLSPDWSAKAEPVPYAKLDNPQSLNLYAYLNNNPLRTTDPDGHEGSPCTGSTANVGCTYTKNEKTNTMTVTETNSTITKQTDSNGNVVSVTQTTTTTKTDITMGNTPAVTGAQVTTDTVIMHTDGSADTRGHSDGYIGGKEATDKMGSDRTAQLQDAAKPSFFQNVKDHPITVGLGLVGGVTTAGISCATVVGCVPGIMLGETIIAASVVAGGTGK